MKILIVDDDTQLRRMLAEICAMVGHEGIVAKNVEHAREILSSEQSIDAVFCDSHMPEMDGASLIAWIKAQNPHLHCTLMSSVGCFDSLPGHKPDGMIKKPFRPEVIFNHLSSLEKIPQLSSFSRS